MIKNILLSQIEVDEALMNTDLAKQISQNQYPPGCDLSAPKIKMSWDPTLEKVPSFVMKLSNMSQGPASNLEEKYLLILDAVSGPNIFCKWVLRGNIDWNTLSNVCKSRRRLAIQSSIGFSC